MTIAPGFDSASPVPAKAARAAGKRWGGLYLFNGVNGWNAINRRTVEDYTACGLLLLSLCEVQASEVSQGEQVGIEHGKLFVESARNVEQPRGSSLFAACDQDPAGLPGGPHGAVAYYRGFAGPVRDVGYLVGGYIGAAGANACLDAGVIDRVMAPNASSWSDGQRYRRVDVMQGYDPAARIGGYGIDPDEANLETAGFWDAHGLWPREPRPAFEWRPAKMPLLRYGEANWAVKIAQEGLKAIGYFHHLTCSGHYLGETRDAVVRFKERFGLPGGPEEFGDLAWEHLFRALRSR